MPDEQPIYTRTQAADLSASAVQQQTAALSAQIDALTAEKAALESANTELSDQVAAISAEKAELEGQVESLSTEKAAAESARDALTAEFDGFKSGLTELAEMDSRKAERLAAVRAAAAHMPDEFFEDEPRQERWAGMSDTEFASVVTTFEESAMAALTPAERTEAEKASDKSQAVRAALEARKGTTDKTQLRETAAFSGGAEPGSKGTGSVTDLTKYLAGRSPAAIRARA